MPTSFIAFNNGLLSVGTIDWYLWGFLSSICTNFILLWISPIQFVAIFIVSFHCKMMKLDIGVLECKSYMGIYSPLMRFQLLNNSIKLWCVLCVHLFFSNLHLDLISFNAFSKIDSISNACTSISLINFWFMFTYNL